MSSTHTPLYKLINAVSKQTALVDYTKDTEIQAAVLVILTEEVAPRLVLTRRSAHLSTHAGEVAFVGGIKEPTDKNAQETALREAFEEIGLPTNAVRVVGYLPCQRSKFGLTVRPVVATLSPDVLDTLVICTQEIARVFWGELSFFVQNAPQKTAMYDPKSNTHFSTPAWHIDGEIVWGLTGRIIADLVKIGFGIHYDWYYKIGNC